MSIAYENTHPKNKPTIEQEAMSRDLPFWLAIGPICWDYTDIVTKGNYKGRGCTTYDDED